MKKCSFIGQRVAFDYNLAEKAVKFIKDLLQKEEELTFYFHYRDEVSNCYLQAVRQVKEECSDAEINIAFYDYKNRSEDRNCLANLGTVWDMQQYDEIIIPSGIDQGMQWYHKNWRIHSWVIQQSDFIFLYDYMSNTDKRLIKQIKKREENSELIVLDMTEEGTWLKLNESIETLSEGMQYVYNQMKAGKKTEVLSEELHISQWRVNQLYSKACIALYTCVLKK